MIRIVIDGAPVAWGRARLGRGASGKPFHFTPAKTRSYQDVLKLAAGAAMQGRPPLDGPLAVTVTAYLPCLASWSKKKRAAALAGALYPDKKPDADNYLKQLDSLNQIVFRDDCLIVDATVTKRYAEKPRLEIEVWPIMVR